MDNIICVHWGTKYPVKFVNILYSMCKRNITTDYEFHCITDSTKDLDPHIKTIQLPNDPAIKTWWSKLWMFGADFPLKGNILYFDLDVIIFNNIDHLFTHNPGKFHIIRDFNRCRVKDWKMSNSSVMRWEAGTMNYLWDEFKANSSKIMSQNHGDQDWITKRAKDDIHWFPDDWIRSYKWEMIGLKDTKLLNKDGKKIFRKPADITPENKVAVFHGEPKPFNCGDEWVVKNWR